MSMPEHFTAELELSGLLQRPAPPSEPAAGAVVLDLREGRPAAAAPAPARADLAVIELPDTPTVGLSQISLPAPATQVGTGGAPAPMTRRARREIELLEEALALPAAGTVDERERQLRAVAFSPTAPSDPATQVGTGGAPDASARAARRSAFGLPQAGMVGVLGLAALIGPTVGHVTHAGTSATAMTLVPAASEMVPTPIGAVADLPATTSSGTPAVVTPSSEPAPDASALLARREAAEQASRAIGERALADEAAAKQAAEREAQAAELTHGCTGVVPPAVLDEGNGQLDTRDLCSLWDGRHQLRPDAAVALARLDLAYREAFGEDIAITDAYRTYGSQLSVRAEKPSLAARPGTSLHGWGIAVDLGGGIPDGGERYRWMMENAGAYGWENPTWARSGGGGPHEPWHWEFVAGRDGRASLADTRT